MATWGTVTTLKESLTTTLNFVAHHLALGASEIYLIFDDPNDPAIEKLKDMPKVYAIRGDDNYWAQHGGRPEINERRQTINANFAYTRAKCDWLIHIDADEWIDCDGVLADCLDGEEGEVLRLEPLEVLHYPKAGQGLYPSHIFKYPLPNGPWGRKIGELVYGRYYPSLHGGFLSHVAGKFFVRTGLNNCRLRIHGPFIDGARNLGHDLANARLLHLHGATYDEWRAHLIRSLEKGAYMAGISHKRGQRRANAPSLDELFRQIFWDEGEEGINEFYKKVCLFSQEKAILRKHGYIYKQYLWVDEEREDLFGEKKPHFHNLSLNNEGQIEGDVWHEGELIHICPSRSTLELALARNLEMENYLETLAEGDKI